MKAPSLALSQGLGPSSGKYYAVQVNQKKRRIAFKQKLEVPLGRQVVLKGGTTMIWRLLIEGDPQH
ncbi:uncharacterized protein Dvar_25390 [Desulfosarcina variabilis str. Montpellier]